MLRQADFLLFITLAATAATPALGQDVVHIPDFSGIWATHPSPASSRPHRGPARS